jgi:hypothetical protein
MFFAEEKGLPRACEKSTCVAALAEFRLPAGLVFPLSHNCARDLSVGMFSLPSKKVGNTCVL